jgi:ribosomal protein S18 acetylase RimI-like enzyme
MADVTSFRTFRNTDPPLIVGLWDACFGGPRVAPVRSATLLEYFVLAKPFFDPRGLILAFDGERPVGFALAAEDVICAIGVSPSHRRRGVGGGLLARVEEYLRGRGVRTAVAGSMAPHNPMLFGLHGGCDSAGILESEAGARQFFERHGYTVARTCGVYQLPLARQQMPIDPRLSGIHQRYDIVVGPYRHAGRWREGVLGPAEVIEFRLQGQGPADSPARMLVWDMEPFAVQWGVSCVGMLELAVEEGQRRRGLAKYLMAQVLRHLRERGFTLFEGLADPDDPAAAGLVRQFDFERVETGHTLTKTLG